MVLVDSNRLTYRERAAIVNGTCNITVEILRIAVVIEACPLWASCSGAPVENTLAVVVVIAVYPLCFLFCSGRRYCRNCLPRTNVTLRLFSHFSLFRFTTLKMYQPVSKILHSTIFFLMRWPSAGVHNIISPKPLGLFYCGKIKNIKYDMVFTVPTHHYMVQYLCTHQSITTWYGTVRYILHISITIWYGIRCAHPSLHSTVSTASIHHSIVQYPLHPSTTIW